MRDGVLCIDKPSGHTSFDVIARMRGILKTRKLGHAGTLDPMATGVLPVFIGRATKACDILPNQDKRYQATFRLGITTDTQDSTGTILRTRPVTVGEEEIRRAVAAFVGEQQQLPPMYSAVRVDGVHLYDLAREGREVERQARQITVYSMEVLDIRGDQVTVEVHCSKGSYVRTLCNDIGERLGCGAALTALRRTMAAGYTLKDALTLEQLTRIMEEGRVDDYILPVDKVFETLPAITLSEKAGRLYKNGVKLDYRRLRVEETDQDIRVYGRDGTFLGVSYLDRESGELRLRKLFSIIQEN